MPRKKSDFDIAVGKRLQLVRLARNKTVKEIADGIGVSIARYSNWEHGVNGADPEVLSRIKPEFGISLDWVYGADITTLDDALAAEVRRLRRIDQDASQASPAPQKRPRAKKIRAA